MTEVEFYALIDAARDGTAPESPSADPDSLFELLSERTDGEVEAFAREFRRQLVRLNRWSVWDAGYAASGGLSDDGFHYFRSWLIGKGAAVVELALADPDRLVPYLDTDELENELIEYVPLDVLDERGVEVDPVADVEQTDGEPAGEQFDEETSEERHPKLTAWAAAAR
ncbi:Protein of unknown function [Agromyces sp. CF514]|uniref:DUF4240 domain-containing protein n=1 Tax=Agromyces sp. CF514 TaxID=1881031 RepID=UPI0008EDFA5E|nr:DUF4240 domain-containing protein [Agromyces sp. CF514]SFR71265.1 Protein of unknown function [Agromyces sp. CF514]